MSALTFVAAVFLAAHCANALENAPLAPHVSKQLFKNSLCDGSATYKIEFNFNWTPATNPSIDFPVGDIMTGAHFSPLVVAGHNRYWTMWAPGGFANRGQEQVAEGGDPTTLLRIMKRERNIFDFGAADSGALGPKATTSMMVKVRGRTRQTYLSAMAMIAPSPDWFVGFYDVNVCYLGHWLDGPLEGVLYGWDAGTSKDGEGFKDKIAPRMDERPKKTIERLPGGFREFGTFKIYRMS